jgi:hypothetical protein
LVRTKLALSTLWSLVLFPLLCLLIAWGLAAYQSAAVRDELRAAVPTVTEEKLNVLDAYTLCTLVDPVRETAPDACYHAAVLHGIVQGALWVIGASVLLVALILLYVRSVRGRTAAVARTLPLVAGLVAAWFTVLTLATAALVLFTIFALSATFVPISFLKVMIVIAAIGGIFKALRPLLLLRAMFRAPTLDYDGARLLPEKDAPKLHALIAKAAARARVPAPDYVIIGLLPGVWLGVTPAALDGRTLRGRTLYVSLPLSRLLTTTELEMLLVAEFFSVPPRSATVAASRAIARLSEGMATLLEANFRIKNLLVLPPAVGVFGLLQGRTKIDLMPALIEAIHRADVAVADLYGPAALAAALLKAHLHVLAWQTLNEGDDAGSTRKRVDALLPSALAIAGAIRDGDAAQQAALADADLDRATYSTPRLALRLERIGATATPTAVRKIRKPARAAATLLPQSKELDAELADAADRMLSKRRFIMNVLAGLESGPGA